MRRTGVVYLLGLLLLTAGPSPVLGAERVTIDQVAIAVGNKVVTQRELEEARTLQINELKTRYQGQELEARIQTVNKTLIDRMIEDLLLENYAKKLKIKIGDQTIEDRVDTILAREPKLRDIYSDEQLKGFVVTDMLRRRVLALEVDSHIRVSDAAVEAECQKSAVENREVDVGHILIRGHGPEALKKIENIRRMLEQGANFEKTADAYSEDPSVTTNHGRLGYIRRGQFVKSFEDKAFSMAVGQLSEPVQTPFGYHLIKVFGKRSGTPQNCAKLDEVSRQSYYSKVYTRLREQRLKDFLARLRQKADIRVFVQ